MTHSAAVPDAGEQSEPLKPPRKLPTSAWPKGKSGNPGGRPKRIGPQALAAYVLDETRQGRELVDHLVEIARGKATTTREVATKDGGTVELKDHPSHRERLVAIQALWDRGMGTAIAQDKMPEPAEVEPGGGETDGIEPPKLGAA